MTGSHRAEPDPKASRTQRPRPARQRPRGLRWVTLAVAVLCLPLTAAVVVLLLHDQDELKVQQARSEAMAAAVSAATEVLSYDYRALDDDLARAQADATGLFAKQYRQTAAALKRQAAQNRAIVQATPSRPGVVSATADEVVLLVFVDQASVRQTAGAETPTTRIDQSRVRMTMTRVGDRWLVSQLSAL
jgi:Mce-associated membrane protein